MKSVVVRSEDGFTLIELLVVVALFCCFVFTPLLICNNSWYTADGVLRELRAYNPEVVRIVAIKPHIFSYSQIETENKDGSRNFYLLDSNILFNYKFR